MITAAWSSPRTAGSPPPPDGGARWLVVFKAGDGGAAFNDLGFTTTADGVAVYGPVYQNDNTYGLPGKLLLSSDGGASWQATVFLAGPGRAVLGVTPGEDGAPPSSGSN